jgi:NAD(P)-dependent dehydrogenase (short-subunit alcohol dehydrogenase family)
LRSSAHNFNSDKLHRKLVNEIESREKCLCILVNNAGIAAPKTKTDEEDPEEARKNLFESTSVKEWTDIYATNVVGPYLMTTAFLPLLQKSTDTHYGYSGCVINITSISGLVKISQGHCMYLRIVRSFYRENCADIVCLHLVSYNSSKGAAVHLNRMLASEVASAGMKIRINSIAPGVFPSEMTTGDSKDNQKSEMPKEHKGMLPSQRPGKESDMAAAILFAASCQYLNGQ